MWWLTLASASTCPTVVETRTAYRPSDGELSVSGDPGGWPKDQLGQLTPSARAKVEMYKRAFKRYPVDVQERLLSGELPDGLDEVAVVLAYGEPGYVWASGRGCIGMLYGLEPDEPAGAVAFEACDGAVTARIELLRPIPCSRIAAGRERWAKRSRHLEDHTFSQQLDIIGGVRADWMDERALELAFGKKGTLSDGMAPVQAAAVPEPVVFAPSAPDPTTRTTEGDRTGPEVVGSRSAPPVGARVDTLTAAPAESGTWRFEAVCGARTFEVDLEVAEGFVARAAAHDPSGALHQHTTRGIAARTDGGTQLYGLGFLKLEPPVLALGPWPITACAGVEAPAR